MKQNAVQNKRYYHGDFRSATTAPEVDTRARNYDLFVQHKTPVQSMYIKGVVYIPESIYNYYHGNHCLIHDNLLVTSNRIVQFHHYKYSKGRHLSTKLK